MLTNAILAPQSLAARHQPKRASGMPQRPRLEVVQDPGPGDDQQVEATCMPDGADQTGQLARPAAATADQGREAGHWWVSATRSAAPELGNRVRSDRQRRRGRRKSRLVPLRAAPAAERRASPPASRRCRRCRSRTGRTGRSALAVRVLWLRSGRERQAYDRWPRWPFAPAHSLGLPAREVVSVICYYLQLLLLMDR